MNIYKLKRAIIYGVLIAFVFILVFPFVWLILNSLKNPIDAFGKVTLLPVNKDGEAYITFVNYIKSIQYLKFGTLFKNTLIVACFNTAINLLLNAMAGYSFARMRFKGSELIFKIMLTSLMIPGTVMLVPNMIIVSRLGVYDSLWALILPFIMSVYNVFLMRQHFLGHSREIEESAIMDGANWLTIFLRIALPLSKPMLVVLGTFTFMWNYGNFLWPLIVINDSKKFVLSRGLGRLMSGPSINLEKYGMMLASSVIIAMPLIILFLFLQKYIISGISAGGVKE